MSPDTATSAHSRLIGKLPQDASADNRDRASIRELGDQGDYFIGLRLNVGRPPPQVNHIVQRVQWLFAPRHGDSTDGQSSNFLGVNLHRWWHGFYACAGKLVNSPFQDILTLQVELSASVSQWFHHNTMRLMPCRNAGTLKLSNRPV